MLSSVIFAFPTHRSMSVAMMAPLVVLSLFLGVTSGCNLILDLNSETPYNGTGPWRAGTPGTPDAEMRYGVTWDPAESAYRFADGNRGAVVSDFDIGPGPYPELSMEVTFKPDEVFADMVRHHHISTQFGKSRSDRQELPLPHMPHSTTTHSVLQKTRKGLLLGPPSPHGCPCL